ncbi:hypothetical protein EW026_g5665 [Hermanssonia centrifuga]|uniref:Uncharacterized protein n=1 Tax=Hermanssonia centrifuga TaxID=98765 RepID=A0A4S4KDF7_9APHY|nr:hypothetical protein EW026_g5665 [Hermanssonia centrifuga]
MGPSLKHLEIEIAPGPIREGATGMLEDIDMSHAVNLLTVTLEINAIYPVATISRLIESTISRVPLSLQTFIFKVGCYHAYTPDDRPRGGVELLSRLDCDLLARAFAGFHGVVTIRLMYPAVWDTADSSTLKTLSRAAHLRLEYVTEAGDVLLYAELPPQNLKGGGMIYKI